MLILALTLLLAAPVLGIAVLVKAVRVLVARRFTRRVGAHAWAEGAWWWAGGAGLAYSVGMWGMLLGDAPDWCPPAVRFYGDPELPDHARIEQSAFPLSTRCVSDVHATVEMVPGFVNPAIVVCLIGAVAFAGVAGVKQWGKSGGSAGSGAANSARA